MSDVITRKEFIRRLVNDSDFTYAHASKAYDNMTRIFSDAVVSGSKIKIGKVMAIVPTFSNPRTVCKGFDRTADGVTKCSKTYYLGKRIKFKVVVYKKFLRNHCLNWFKLE